MITKLACEVCLLRDSRGYISGARALISTHQMARKVVSVDFYPSKWLEKFYQLLCCTNGILQSFLKGDAEAIVGCPQRTSAGQLKCELRNGHFSMVISISL